MGDFSLKIIGFKDEITEAIKVRASSYRGRNKVAVIVTKLLPTKQIMTRTKR